MLLVRTSADPDQTIDQVRPTTVTMRTQTSWSARGQPDHPLTTGSGELSERPLLRVCATERAQTREGPAAVCAVEGSDMRRGQVRNRLRSDAH